MAEIELQIDIEKILGDKNPEFIPIKKCVASNAQMRQSNTTVTKGDKIVDHIRKAGGLLHPIIVKKLDSGDFEVIVGQKRTNAHFVLKDEDPKYNRIKAYVIDKDLNDDEKRVISFIENFGRDDPSKSDYINVIEYFYMKYNGNMTMTAAALGITTESAKQYLTHARLSERVKECMTNGEFNIAIAMRALKALGDDESSVNEDMLINTARALKEQKPAVRERAVKKMIKDGVGVDKAIDSSQKVRLLKIDLNDTNVEQLEEYKTKHEYETIEYAAVEAIMKELTRDLDVEQEI